MSRKPPDRSADRGRAVRVFVAGTFDGLHYGHLFLLTDARRRGADMVRRLGRSTVHLVVVARDESVERIKGRAPHHNQNERRHLVTALQLVDEAFVGNRDDFIRSVRPVRPDLIMLGYDQSRSWEEILRTCGIAIPIVRSSRYHDRRLKSSILRADLEQMRT